jgi:hypothetical protein
VRGLSSFRKKQLKALSDQSCHGRSTKIRTMASYVRSSPAAVPCRRFGQSLSQICSRIIFASRLWAMSAGAENLILQIAMLSRLRVKSSHFE